MTTTFQLGQTVRVISDGRTGTVVKLPSKVRLYRVRFEDGSERAYFYTRLAAC